MLFPVRFHPGLADGSITLTFRNWRRPQVKVGGRYNVGSVALEVDGLEVVAMSDITAEDADRAGFADRGELVRFLERHAADDRRVYRITFHAAGPAVDKLAPLRTNATLSPDDLATINARLDKLDANSGRPWTRATLQLIRDNPARRAGDLADMVGRERLPFKADVRKLKSLGLTESLDVGYRLSPRGEAYVTAGFDG